MSNTNALHATHHLAYDGAVDADGHILEPPDLWERYLEPKYRDRALRFVLDADGLEALEIGGQPSVMSRRGFPSTLGAMGDPDLRAMQLDPERTYLREAPYGSMDPKERLELLDAEGIDAAILYTTVGLLWEAELDDRRVEDRGVDPLARVQELEALLGVHAPVRRLAQVSASCIARRSG